MSNSQPSRRCSARPCEVASITACVQPASTISASNRCTAGASGVVSRVGFGTSRPAMRDPTVLSRPARSPQPSRAASVRKAVVDLPSVPVMPMTVSRRAGWPSCAAATAASARRVSGTAATGTPRPRAPLPPRLRHDCHGAGPRGGGREVVAVGTLAGDADEDVAGSHLARVMPDRAHVERQRRAGGAARDALAPVASSAHGVIVARRAVGSGGGTLAPARCAVENTARTRTPPPTRERAGPDWRKRQ